MNILFAFEFNRRYQHGKGDDDDDVDDEKSIYANALCPGYVFSPFFHIHTHAHAHLKIQIK